MSRPTGFIALVCVLCMVVLSHAQDERPLIAISPLQAKKVDPEEVDLISEAMAGEFQNTGEFRVMERSQMDRILKEQGFQTSGICDGNECAVEVGKVLGIDRMVVGSVGRIGTMYVINVRMVDVASGEILGSVHRTEDRELKFVLTNLVPQVAKALSTGQTEDQPVVAAEPVPAPAAPTAPAPAPAPAVSESGGSVWPWLLGGGVLAAGGAAAYFLLLQDDGGADPAPSVPGGDNTGTSTVSIPVTW